MRTPAIRLEGNGVQVCIHFISLPLQKKNSSSFKNLKGYTSKIPLLEGPPGRAKCVPVYLAGVPNYDRQSELKNPSAEHIAGKAGRRILGPERAVEYRPLNQGRQLKQEVR